MGKLGVLGGGRPLGKLGTLDAGMFGRHGI